MATKKVEEEKVKGKKKATTSSADKTKKKTATKKVTKTEEKDTNKKVAKTTKKTNVKKTNEVKEKTTKPVKKEKEETKKEEFLEEEVVVVKSKKYSYDDEEDDDDLDEYDDEDYDDEDLYEERVVVKKEKDTKEEIEEETDETEEVEEVKAEKVSKKKEKEEKKKKAEKPVKEEKNKKDKKKDKKKQLKAEKYISKNSGLSDENEDIFNLIKIVIAIGLIVVVVYLLVAFLNGEFKKDETDAKESETVSEIQNEKILASSIFNKEDKEYYVLMYDGSNEWANYYGMIYSEYKYIEDATPLFWVDLGDSFNKDVVATGDEETNSDAQEYSELKVKVPTLIHIKKGKNVDYYEGDEAVKELKALIESYKEEESE